MNPQHSAEWLASRLGKCTGSRVKDATSFLKKASKNGQKGDSSGPRNAYLIEKVSERLTGFAAEHYVSREMQWGIDNERYAVAAYEVVSGNETDLVGFVNHPTIENFGASPDRLIGTDGILECKCPTTATHLGYLLANEVPEEYVPQCYAEMACTGRKWVDFVSFDPRLPVRQRIFIKRLERDDAEIAELEKGVVQFLREVDDMMIRLGAVEQEKAPPKRQERAWDADDPRLGIQDEDLPGWWREKAGA